MIVELANVNQHDHLEFAVHLATHIFRKYPLERSEVIAKQLIVILESLIGIFSIETTPIDQIVANLKLLVPVISILPSIVKTFRSLMDLVINFLSTLHRKIQGYSMINPGLANSTEKLIMNALASIHEEIQNTLIEF